jgi:hypothetical protein
MVRWMGSGKGCCYGSGSRLIGNMRNVSFLRDSASGSPILQPDELSGYAVNYNVDDNNLILS